MASILKRGEHQYRVLVRRKGVTRCKTFESRREAEDWARIIEGKVSGGEIIPKTTMVSLAEACTWFEGQIGSHANARNERGHAAYWKTSELAAWSLSVIHDWDLIEWRKRVLDEMNAEDDGVGPDAQFGAQTCIHRLNAISKIIQTWGRAHRVAIENPVRAGVRPGKPDGRTRRLLPDEETLLLDAAAKSSRPWLREAIIIAVETAMRQSEMVNLTWSRVNLDRRFIDLLKTKNDRARRVPLSERAIAALRALPAGTSVLPVVSGTGVHHAFRDAKGEGFPDLRWHDLRHEAICRLFEDTDLRDHEIMAISGHLTPAMLSRYTHLRTHTLADRLPGGKANTRAA